MGPPVDQVLDAARYLRGVRPLDPEELVEYVRPRPDPAEIADILRSRAWSLDLVETVGGTFEPVPEVTIGTDPRPVRRLPAALNGAIASWLEDVHGEDWATGRSGEAIRDRLEALKAAYLREETATYEDDLDAAAHLIYHFPRSYAATVYVLGELIEAGVLAHKLRVLDVGAGTGAHLAGLADATPPESLVRYDAVEPSRLGTVFDHLESTYLRRNVHVERHHEPIEAVDLAAEYDLVLLGNVLSELEDPAAVARETFDRVAPSGAWLGIAPADPRTSRQLYALERALAPPGTVFAPGLRLWPGRRPSDPHWSFVERPELEVPPFQRRLAAPVPAGSRSRYHNPVVRYSYVTLRRDERRRYDVTADREEHLPLGDAEALVGSRVTVLAVKLSQDLSEGSNRLYRIADGSQGTPWFASHVVETDLTRTLIEAPHGGVVVVRRGLILWNDDEEAFNLVVDDETVVDRVAP